MANRTNFIRIINEICEEEQIRVTHFSSDWGHRLSKNGRTAYIVGYQFPQNPASSKEICQDKVLTYQVLSAAGVPAAIHIFAPTPAVRARGDFPDSDAIARKWLDRDGVIVVKDNYGTGGNSVEKAVNFQEYEEILSRIHQSSYAGALCPFYDIREEYRVTMLNGQPKMVIRKERESRTLPDGTKEYLNWRHNLGQGATGILVTDPEMLKPLCEMAKKTVKALDMRFCSVDIIDTGGQLLVLEVNGGVMMEHFAGQSPETYRKAKAIYREAILDALE